MPWKIRPRYSRSVSPPRETIEEAERLNLDQNDIMTDTIENQDGTTLSPTKRKSLDKNFFSQVYHLEPQMSMSKNYSEVDLRSKQLFQNELNQSNPLQNAAYQLKKFLIPDMKTRNTEFKNLFQLPGSENYIIGYSCALVKDFLIHGKMYISQNYLCFYSNIFSFETKVKISYKEMKNLKKKKTAKIIPNAIEIFLLNGERLFFTSFTSRDKTFVAIYKLWQYSLLNKAATTEEIWEWTHFGKKRKDTDTNIDDKNKLRDENSAVTDSSSIVQCLSDQPTPKLVNRASIPVIIYDKLSLTRDTESESESETESKSKKRQKRQKKKHQKKSCSLLNIPLSVNPNSLSVSNLLDYSSEDCSIHEEVSCQCPQHEGKEILNSLYSVSVEQMFLLLFTDCEFYRRMQLERNNSNLILHDWCHDKKSGVKSRQITFRASLSKHSFGPKSCEVVENQICEEWDTRGQKCIVKSSCQSSGVPYSDTFNTFSHYCITKVASNQCRLRVHCGTTFTKNCWGITKNFIEKNTNSGMSEYFEDLDQRLQAECTGYGLIKCNKTDEKVPKMPSDLSKCATGRLGTGLKFTAIEKTVKLETVLKLTIVILLLMLVTNIILFYKLLLLEKNSINFDHLQNKASFSSHSWNYLMKHELYRKQKFQWAERLKITIETIDKIERTVQELKTHLFVIRNDLINNFKKFID